MISIIIPTYNEKQNIIALLNEIKKRLVGKNFEIIIVDDNSPDQTAQAIKTKFKKDKKIKVFVRKNERGLGTAILYGIKKSKGEIIIGMDADFNHPPQIIPNLIKNTKDADLVVTSRFINDGGMADRKRYFFTFLFNLFLKYFLGFPVFDNTSGFYAIKKSKLYQLPLEEIYRGYGDYHLRLVWYARKLGLKIKEIPVFYPKRKYGNSKSNLIKMFFQYFIVAFKLRFFQNKKSNFCRI
jgi:dolichol-phosphate mannosyltransferase